MGAPDGRPIPPVVAVLLLLLLLLLLFAEEAAMGSRLHPPLLAVM